MPASATERAAPVLIALVTRVLDGAPLANESVVGVAAEVSRRVASLSESRRRDIARVFALLESRVVGLAMIGRPLTFAGASSVQQDRWLASWSESPAPPLRSAFQAMRRLVLAAHYGNPDVAAALGHAGPLHRRTPAVAWEGPLTSAHPDERTKSIGADSPVARGTADLRPALSPTVPPPGVIPSSAVDGHAQRRVDAIVIGTGAGGAVAAARLAAFGLEVVVVEEGGYFGAADFVEQEVPLAEQLYADGAMRATDDLAVQLLQGRAVGGSTLINWMIMLRTPEFVLNEWQRLHGLHDFGVQTMAPVFERIEQEVNARAVPSDAHSPNNRVILDGARALGWRASTAVINAKGCVRSGYCGIGCRYDAKQSTLLTYIPLALAHGATVYCDARADHIEVIERDSGQPNAPLKRVHVQLHDRTSGAPTHRLTLEAPLVIVSAGAVGTPVLLQRSGLGGDAVGRYLRLHPTTATVGVFADEIVGSAGIPLSAMCDEHLQWRDSNYGFWLECPPFLPALGAVAAPGFGAGHATLMRQFRHLGSVIALTRDGADVDHSSGAVSVRKHGETSITYSLSAADAQRVRASVEAAARLQLAAGAREVYTLHTTPLRIRRESELEAVRRAPVGANRIGLFSAHVNGTCRMGTNPRTAATSPDGEVFGTRGLFVCDGSLLPTALGVNPQATIMALATLVAERIALRYGPAATPQGALV